MQAGPAGRLSHDGKEISKTESAEYFAAIGKEIFAVEVSTTCAPEGFSRPLGNPVLGSRVLGSITEPRR